MLRIGNRGQPWGQDPQLINRLQCDWLLEFYGQKGFGLSVKQGSSCGIVYLEVCLGRWHKMVFSPGFLLLWAEITLYSYDILSLHP